MPTLPFRGHQANFFSLLDLYSRGRLPHALLITGPEGIGKSGFAIHLAGAILCQEKNPPCGTCGSCRLFSEEKHPDLLKIVGEKERIKVDAIRELIQNFNFAPLMGPHRVVVLPEAHLMNAAAANALLKTLEEPPVGTYFLLVSHAPGWMPRTIVSRCQNIRLHSLSDKDLMVILDPSGLKISPDLLNEAMGSAGRALRLASIRQETPSLEILLDPKKPLGADRAFQLAQAIVDEEKLEPFLEALMADAHHRLVSTPGDADLNFDLLAFTDKILQMRRRMKLNINPKMALSRLLLFFREPLSSRLEI